MLSMLQSPEDLAYAEVHFAPTETATHLFCSNPEPVQRVIRLRGSDPHNFESVDAVDDFACAACGREGTTTSNYTSLTAALGAPPEGSPITAEEVAADLIATLAEARAEMSGQEVA